MKQFDDDVVGADLCVRPDAEVDVSGQTHRSAPTASSLVVAITRCVKRFDNGAVGADLRVRPECRGGCFRADT